MKNYYLIDNKDGKKYYLMVNQDDMNFKYTDQPNSKCVFDENTARTLSDLFFFEIEKVENKLELFITTGAINKAYFVDINDSYLCIESYNELFEIGKFYNKGHFEMERYYRCLDSVSDSFKYFKMLSENIEAILMKFQDLPF